MNNLTRRNELFLLLTLAGIQFTHILDFMIMMPLGPQFMRLFQISPAQFGGLVSSYTIASAVSGIIGGYFADTFNRKKFLIFLYIGFILGTTLCGLSSSFWQLLLARITAGVFGGLLGGCIYSIVGDVIPFEKRGRAMGVIMTAFSISSVAGVPLGLFFANKWSWHIAFFFIAALSFIILLFAFKTIPPIHPEKDHDFNLKKYLKVFSYGNHINSFLLIFFVANSGFMLIPYISTYLVLNIGIKEIEIPYVYLFGGAATIITSRIVGVFTDKKGPFKTFATLSVCALLPIILLTHHGPAKIWQVLMVSVPFMVFMSGRVIPIMTLVTETSHPSQKGAFLSVYTSVRHISNGIASFTGGLIIGKSASGQLTHYNSVGYLSIFCILMSIILGFNLHRRSKIS